MAKSKKLTAVVAIGCAAVMALSGTFAWILQQDETKLNSFTHEITDYGVKIEEDFEAWVNKDVTVKATGVNEVIVRARFEEFLSIDGKTTDVAQQSGIYTATALADAENPNGNDIRKDASKLNPQIVDLYFGEKFITMAEWTTKTAGVTGTALAELYNEGWWIVDTDGWCYYTKALGNNEASNLSLSNALLNVTDNELKESYGTPVNLDYNINVRVQAISADLSDYGATDNPAQWSCETTGRVIDDDPDVANEILSDTPITAEADKVVTLVANTAGTFKTTPYTYTITAATETAPAFATITGFNLTDNSVINNIDGYDWQTNTIVMPTTVEIEGTEYDVKYISANSFRSSTLLNGEQIVLPEKLTGVGGMAFFNTKLSGTLTIPATVSSIADNGFNTARGITKVVFEGTNNTTVYDGEQATTLYLGKNVFNDAGPNQSYYRNNLLGEVVLPVRTYTSIPSNVFWTATFSKICYSLNGGVNFAGGGYGTAYGVQYIPYGDTKLLGYAVTLNTDETATLNGFASNVAAKTDVPGYDAETNTLTMPTTVTYNGVTYTVTRIKKDAFNNNIVNSVHIVLPTKIQAIEEGAFRNKSINGELVIPESVTFIGYQAFQYNCATNVVFCGANGTENPTYVIGSENESNSLVIDGSFSYSSSTQEVRLPARTTEIKNYAFYSANFAKVTYPSTAVTSGTAFSVYNHPTARY